MEHVLVCALVVEGNMVKHQASRHILRGRALDFWDFDHRVHCQHFCDTFAGKRLGTMINIMEIIRKDMMICMAYCIKAIILPTCMVESAI